MLKCNATALIVLFSLLAGPLAAQAEPEAAPPIRWHEVSPAEVVGQGWKDTKSPFDRLPAHAEKVAPKAVWDLSHHSAGLYVDFASDAKSITARWTLTSDRLAMPHMPATGVSGLDLYVKQGGKWHYLATGRPTEPSTNEVTLTTGLAGTPGDFRLYFPLYNGVSKVEIGVPEGASIKFTSSAESGTKPVVIYGTSITQGGCASRPGMSYAAILGRRLGVPVVNLGFSGSGKAEVEMARLVAEIDASVFVLDPLPNLFPEQVAERLPGFVKILREKHPQTPILLNECPLYPPIMFVSDQKKKVADSNEFLRQVGKRQADSGDLKIFLVPACDLEGEFGESTVDGIHPTDIGFVMMADVLEPYLRKALK